MKISDRATTVAVPLAAPLRHANGAHWGRFVRTIVEVETDEGLIDLGEMGGVFIWGPHSRRRPEWFAVTPEARFAQPAAIRKPKTRSSP